MGETYMRVTQRKSRICSKSLTGASRKFFIRGQHNHTGQVSYIEAQCSINSLFAFTITLHCLSVFNADTRLHYHQPQIYHRTSTNTHPKSAPPKRTARVYRVEKIDIRLGDVQFASRQARPRTRSNFDSGSEPCALAPKAVFRALRPSSEQSHMS
ncbi:hypothetical protein CC86DRAFT_3922 [Ophiobolus disseminans]|uniref:Uncharacterized protein n=1 Tax=Ophiobolus disseminans TaxID=1469910 RepID=A0A6A7AJZ6_9PLEO|nr:hypothetical protein CC86DRAFT_3922 [Ophiobolus disseminans]